MAEFPLASPRDRYSSAKASLAALPLRGAQLPLVQLRLPEFSLQFARLQAMMSVQSMRPTMSLRVMTLFFCAAVLVSGPRLWAQDKAPASGKADVPAYTADPQFQHAMSEAEAMLRRHQYSFAVDSYKKANKIAGGSCVACLEEQWTAQADEGDFKGAVTTAGFLESNASTPAAKSRAEYFRAHALYLSAGDKGKADKLEAAHGALQEAIGDNPSNAAALFLDGKVLARLGKMEEAKAEFAHCVSCVSAKDPAKLRAEHFAENPELALHKMAPSFEVTALDGSRFNLDAMGGRVVLIDFWATWCGPCNAELPHMKRIAAEFAGEPLVIISVSWDEDEGKWKDFIAKNSMTWTQYRDSDHKLSEQFGVNAIPHYFTIDSDGVLTAEMLGEGADVEGKLKKLLAKAREAHRETAALHPSAESTLAP